LGHFRDKVTYLPQSVVRSYAGNIEKTIIGRPISSLFGYVTDGIFQNQTEVDAHATQPGKGVGRIRYRDLNHDGVIDVLDQDWLGEAIPDLEFGLNSSLSYKRFSLTFFLQGLTGRYELNANKNQSDLLGAFAGQNNSPRLLQAWTPQNPNASIPAVSNFDANNETRTSDYQIENTSYLKLRNIQLAYSLPQTIQRKLGMSNCQLFISGIDLITIKSKDFTNPDPEAPNSFYPIPRTIIFGCNITF